MVLDGEATEEGFMHFFMRCVGRWIGFRSFCRVM